MTASSDSIVQGGAAPAAPPVSPLRPVPDNVTLYQTLHLVRKDLHNQNHGVLTRHRWFHVLRGCHRILEVGCGNGDLCRWLSGEYGKAMTGVDLVTGPYKREGYEFQTCDIEQEDLPRGFEAAVSFDVLEHIQTDKVGRVLANIGRSAPVLVFTIAGYGSPPEHLTVQSPGWWLDQLIQCTEPRNWSVETFNRYPQLLPQRTPVWLFMGTPL